MPLNPRHAAHGAVLGLCFVCQKKEALSTVYIRLKVNPGLLNPTLIKRERRRDREAVRERNRTGAIHLSAVNSVHPCGSLQAVQAAAAVIDHSTEAAM